MFLALCITLMTAAQDRAFKTLGISDGLRSNSVTSVLADSRGYLWIGTYQGLNRYDGHQVKTRFPESSDPLFYDGRGLKSGCSRVVDAVGPTFTFYPYPSFSILFQRSGCFCKHFVPLSPAASPVVE